MGKEEEKMACAHGKCIPIIKIRSEIVYIDIVVYIHIDEPAMKFETYKQHIKLILKLKYATLQQLQ